MGWFKIFVLQSKTASLKNKSVVFLCNWISFFNLNLQSNKFYLKIECCNRTFIELKSVCITVILWGHPPSILMKICISFPPIFISFIKYQYQCTVPRRKVEEMRLEINLINDSFNEISNIKKKLLINKIPCSGLSLSSLSDCNKLF